MSILSLRPPRFLHSVLATLAVSLAGVVLVLARPAPAPAPAATLELRKGDHICFIGNTLPDRMQHDGWLETLIHSRFPKHDLVFRDLGFSADEVGGFTDRPDFYQRLRSANFGSSDDWLTRTKADVIFAFFGYNESFAGQARAGAISRRNSRR